MDKEEGRRLKEAEERNSSGSKILISRRGEEDDHIIHILKNGKEKNERRKKISPNEVGLSSTFSLGSPGLLRRLTPFLFILIL